MKNNVKTTTDMWFEKYLIQEGLNYQFEPYGSIKGKNPDFLVSLKNIKVLVECKEIEYDVFDKVKGVGSVNIDEHWNLLRAKIYEASQQLKPHSNKIDYNVIILGKAKGFSQISINDLHYAMFGNPVIRIPIRTKAGDKVSKAQFDLKVMGALRKNHPKTRTMYFPHSYVSAIGIVQEFGALNYYKQKFYDKLFEGFYDKNKPIEDQLSEAFSLMEREWKKHVIPKEYKNPRRRLYRLLLIVNPLSEKPFPAKLFHGTWDKIRLPEVINVNL